MHDRNESVYRFLIYCVVRFTCSLTPSRVWQWRLTSRSLPFLTILQNTFYCGSPSVSWSHPISESEVVLTYRHCSVEGRVRTVVPVATQALQRATGADGDPLQHQTSFCSMFFHTGSKLVKTIRFAQTFPTFRTCTGLRSRKRQLRSLETPHITVCLDFTQTV